MFPDRARPLPLIPVTVYEGDTIQTMYRPFQEALANRFVGDFQRFLEHSVRAEARQRFEGAALVAYRPDSAILTIGYLDFAHFMMSHTLR